MSRSQVAIVVMVLTLTALPAEASVARAVTFDEKVERAEAIIRGKCIRTHSQWDSAHRMIVTYSTFKVLESLKGFAPPEVTIITPGGEVDGIRQESSGIRPFREGDENIVFVRSTPAGPTVLFFDQGAYDVVDTGEKEKKIVPFATGAVLIDTQRGMAVAAEPARSLSAFRDELRASVSTTGAKRMEIIREPPAPKKISFWEAIGKYKPLVALALIGALISGWQLKRL